MKKTIALLVTLDTKDQEAQFLKEQIEEIFFQDIVRKPPNDKGNGPPFKLFIYVQMLSYIAPLLFSIAMKTTKRWA